MYQLSTHLRESGVPTRYKDDFCSLCTPDVSRIFCALFSVRRLILLCCSSLTSSDIKTAFFVLYLTCNCPLCSNLYPVLHWYMFTFAILSTHYITVVGYIRVGPYARVYSTSHLYPRFPYTRFPSWHCLHSVSITRAFSLPIKTCYNIQKLLINV